MPQDQLPSLETFTPRLARGTLTPRLDCLRGLTEEERRDPSKVTMCLFPRLAALVPAPPAPPTPPPPPPTPPEVAAEIMDVRFEEV